MKPSRQDMLKEIDSSLTAIGAATHDLLVPNKQGNLASEACLYAAYLHGLVLETLGSLGVACQPVMTGSLFCIRRHNGAISDPNNCFSYVTFTRGKNSYELHVSVYVRTRSYGTWLELDVAIFSRASCQTCRSSQTHPPFRSNRLIIEAKFHARDISTGEAKEFIGVWDRIGGKKKVAALVSNAPISDLADRLVVGVKEIKPFGEVSPLVAHQATTKDFVDFLKTGLTSVL